MFILISSGAILYETKISFTAVKPTIFVCDRRLVRFLLYKIVSLLSILSFASRDQSTFFPAPLCRGLFFATLPSVLGLRSETLALIFEAQKKSVLIAVGYLKETTQWSAALAVAIAANEAHFWSLRGTLKSRFVREFYLSLSPLRPECCW